MTSYFNINFAHRSGQLKLVNMRNNWPESWTLPKLVSRESLWYWFSRCNYCDFVLPNSRTDFLLMKGFWKKQTTSGSPWFYQYLFMSENERIRFFNLYHQMFNQLPKVALKTVSRNSNSHPVHEDSLLEPPKVSTEVMFLSTATSSARWGRF